MPVINRNSVEGIEGALSRAKGFYESASRMADQHWQEMHYLQEKLDEARNKEARMIAARSG